MPNKKTMKNGKEDEVNESISSDEEEIGEQSEDDDDDEEEGVPVSDLDSDEAEEDADIVPYQKLHKDNHAALTQALSTFALPISTLRFSVHQSFTTSDTEAIDVNDDLNRELAFYKQALAAVKEGRKRLLAEGLPFSRPADYFAEMIKDDEHMEKVSANKPGTWLIGRSKNELLQKRLLRKLLKQRNVNAISKKSVKASKSKNSKNDKRKRDLPSRKLKVSRKVLSLSNL